jgi:trigger factor
MVGMNPGETKEISAQFPDPYANEELAGKAAKFTVTLKEIKEKSYRN